MPEDKSSRRRTAEQEARQKVGDAFMRALASNRAIFAYFGWSFVVLMILGISFWLVALAILWSFVSLAQLFPPAYRLFASLFPEADFPKPLPRPAASTFVATAFQLVVSALFILIAVKSFQQLGACGQSPACIIAEVWIRQLAN
jgi:hypothetical protein